MKKRIVRKSRGRYLTPEEAERYRKVREQVEEELPTLVAEHHARMASRRELVQRLSAMLRAEREAAGLSLAEMADRTGMDKAALSRLENPEQGNPTVETLQRYADALGKKLQVRFVDEERGVA